MWRKKSTDILSFRETRPRYIGGGVFSTSRHLWMLNLKVSYPRLTKRFSPVNECLGPYLGGSWTYPPLFFFVFWKKKTFPLRRIWRFTPDLMQTKTVPYPRGKHGVDYWGRRKTITKRLEVRHSDPSFRCITLFITTVVGDIVDGPYTLPG